jgi:hypothetical protein
VRVDSSEFLIASKLTVMKGIEKEFRLIPSEFPETLDQMMLNATNPIDRIVAFKMKVGSGTSFKSSEFRKISDEVIELLWTDFENGSAELRQNILLTMISADLSATSYVPSMTKFYQIYSTGSGMLRILSVLNILVREKPFLVPFEVIRSLFSVGTHSYLHIRMLAPSSLFMMELLRAFAALTKNNDLMLRSVFLRSDISRLLRDAAEEGDPYIQSELNNLVNR